MANNNIIGEEFAKYVQDQINLRQKIHGSGTSNNPRSNDYLNYLNSKTAWVKLASGVKITKERLQKEGMDPDMFSDLELAKNRVLFGGTSKLNETKLTQRGTSPTENNISNPNVGTYNVNQKNQTNDLEFGLVPMPGITSVDIKNKNRGSIKEATVKITAYTREQFDFLDILYMRLGYTVFLEWGWGIYFDNEEDDQTRNYTLMDYTLIEDPEGFFNSTWGQSKKEGVDQKTFSNFLSKISEYREKYSGNYDGLLAKVRNFDWTISSDGTYDITLSLISVGDVIESLKMNIPPSKEAVDLINKQNILAPTESENLARDGNPPTTPSPMPADNSLIALLTFYKLSDIQIGWENGLSYKLNGKDITNQQENSGVGRYVTLSSKVENQINQSFVYNVSGMNEDNILGAQNKFKELRKEFLSDILSGTITFVVEFDNGSSVNAKDTKELTRDRIIEAGGYIHFILVGTYQINTPSTLTSTSQEIKDVFVLNYVDEEGKKNLDNAYYIRLGYLLRYIENAIIPIEKNTLEKIVKIHTDQWDSNRMYHFPFQHSHDPRVCIVRSKFPVGINDSFEILPQLPGWFEEGNDYAFLMNIYINFQQIESSINDNLDEEGNLSLFDFLSSLCTAINKALGGVNNLEPVIEEETNTIRIIDGSYTPDQAPSNGYSLELYGYNPIENTSNFVRNFSVNSTVSKEYASMISIGATAAGYTKGMEATMLSKWNTGIVDRFKEEYIQSDASINPIPTGSANEAVINYIENVLFKPPTTNESPNGGYYIDTELINSQVSFATEFYKYCQFIFQQKNPKYGSPIIGFVPISLNLTMDGISGMKIYNVVRTSTRFLPKNYGDSLRFITTSVNHKLSNNDWETIIDTMVIPENYDKEGQKIILPYNERFEEVKRVLIENALLKYGPTQGQTTGTLGKSENIITAKINPVGIDQLNSAPSISNTPLLKKAVRDQSIYMFTKVPYNGRIGEITGICAGYTFNIALKLKEHIDKKSPQAIPIIYTKSGAANSNAHRDAINALGLYNVIYLGSFTAEQLRNSDSIINTTKWNYGDILNYYSPGNSGDTNMHSQIYTGDIWQKSVYKDNNGKTQTPGNSGWTTSVATNYGGKFIYKGDKVFKVYAFKVKDEYLK
jgi:hypothetical protein